MKTLPALAYSLLCVTGLSFTPRLQAELLVYEGFNYGGSDIDLTSTTVATNNTGFKGDYTSVGASSNLDYLSSGGLDFSSNFLAGTGGGISGSVTGNNDQATLQATLDLSAAHTGTLYQSFLMEFSTYTTDAVLVSRLYNVSTRLQTALDGGQVAGVGYDNTRTKGSGTISLGTTYLAVSRFTNVNGAGGGNADVFFFTETSYDNWFAAGKLEADLGTYANFSASETSTSVSSFATNDTMAIVLYRPTAAGTLTAGYDELRIGTSLEDVMYTVPEPSSAVLIFISFGLLLLFKKK